MEDKVTLSAKNHASICCIEIITAISSAAFILSFVLVIHLSVSKSVRMNIIAAPSSFKISMNGSIFLGNKFPLPAASMALTNASSFSTRNVWKFAH